MQNGGCPSDQDCYLTENTEEPCNPLLETCFNTTCNDTIGSYAAHTHTHLLSTHILSHLLTHSLTHSLTHTHTNISILDGHGVCPAGWVFNECGSLCQRTCEEYLTNTHINCPEHTCAMPDCVCPEGLVVYKDRCVDPLECHSLINRKSFHMHNMSHNCAQSITTMTIVYVNTKFS